jgi:RNAse (barnase) inhibitor barstar
MHSLTLDWSSINSKEDLWNVICREGQEPTWHGRNLAALNDSWVTGGINQTGPPYEFCFLNCPNINESIQDLAKAIMEIALDSVDKNGGSYLVS